MTRLVLEANGRIDRFAALAVLRNHAIPGAESTDPEHFRHTRLLTIHGRPHQVSIEIGPTAVHVETEPADPTTLAHVTQKVRWWLDLDTDTDRIAKAFGRDPVLGPLVAKRPGLRVIRYPHVFEAAVMIILGQQVSLAAARTFGERLVAAYGVPGPRGLRGFPSPAVVAAAPVEEIRTAVGITGARARAVHAIATAIVAGLRIGAGADRAATRRALLELPGIGPWTADCLAVRALGDPDAFPASDLVLRRALGGATATETTAAAQAWRPWRAYALFHLWAEETAAS